MSLTTKAPSVPGAQQIALLRFNARPYLPTVLHRVGGWNLDQGLLYDRFRLATEVDGRTDPLNTYRQFKDDLLLTAGELARIDRSGWHMIDRRSSEGREAEVYRKVGGRNQIFNAVHATEAFLYRVASLSVRRARELFPGARALKVHFTVPAYQSDDQDTAGAIGESEQFRNHLRTAVRAFASRPEFSEVEFRLVTGDRQWLYEPYGVYYYYAALESRIPLRQAGATYLIFDMGGSTTDLAVVQVNKRGTEFQQYPTCASIKLGGADFDKFLLRRLSPRPFRGSAAERDDVLAAIEGAKIALSNGQAEADLSLSKRKVTLTREALEGLFRDFWAQGEGKTSLRKEIRSFVRRVQQKAVKNRLFHEFDAFSGVFLAGGCIQLPGLQELVRAELEALDVLRTDSGVFAVPAPGVEPGSIPAMGLAAEMTRFDPLERATAVYAHIADDVGNTYRFSSLSAASGNPEETLLFTKGFLDAGQVVDGWTDATDKAGYDLIPLAGNRVPREIRMRLRNDAETEYQHDDAVAVEAMSPVVRNVPLKVSLRSLIKSVAEGEGIRVKPILRLHEAGPGAAKKPIRLRREGEGNGHARISYDVSLKPPPVPGDLHICVDFGMSNTTVAFMAPGEEFPESADLDVFAIGTGRVSARRIRFDGPVVSPSPTVGEREVQRDSVRPALGDTGAGVQQTRDEPDGYAPRFSVEADREGVGRGPETPPIAMAVDTAAVDRVVSTAVAGLRDALVEVVRGALSYVSTREPAPVLHPMDRIMENWLAGGPVTRPRAAEDETSRLGEAPPCAVEERFRRFIEVNHPSLEYAPDVVRAVLSECESDDSRLIVLAGPPGTGKSQLVQVLAEFYNQSLVADELAEFYLLQPVSPSWYSPASLQGGYSEVEGRFRETPFLSHLLQAQLHFEECVRSGQKPRLFFVCLDEFNLAQPEQYLADILSRMEARRESEQRVLNLCRTAEVPGLSRDITVRLTPNLKLFATLNVDASTHMLSPKVLDRSHFVRLRPTSEGLGRVAQRQADERKVHGFHARFERLLPDLATLFEEANTPLGYRSIVQAYRYAAFCTEGDEASVVDEALCSFLLSRLPAVFAIGSREYAEHVEKVGEICGKDYPRAARLLRRVAQGLPGQSV